MKAHYGASQCSLSGNIDYFSNLCPCAPVILLSRGSSYRYVRTSSRRRKDALTGISGLFILQQNRRGAVASFFTLQDEHDRRSSTNGADPRGPGADSVARCGDSENGKFCRPPHIYRFDSISSSHNPAHPIFPIQSLTPFISPCMLRLSLFHFCNRPSNI